MYLGGYEPNMLFTKILDLIDSGITTGELREHPEKYLFSKNTKKILYWSGGGSGVLSREIIKEMAKRGDEIANNIINNCKEWKYISKYTYTLQDSKILKNNEIIENGKIVNTTEFHDDVIYYTDNFIFREKLIVNEILKDEDLCINFSQFDKNFRTNKYLIEIVEDKSFCNIGGWTINVAIVNEDENSYKIIKEHDGFGYESIYGIV